MLFALGGVLVLVGAHHAIVPVKHQGAVHLVYRKARIVHGIRAELRRLEPDHNKQRSP